MTTTKLPGGAGALCILILPLAWGTAANAALLGRLPATPGGTDYQAYYDTRLGITWIADANLAASNTFGLPYDTDLGRHPRDTYSGYWSYEDKIHPNGGMTWGAALHWIDAMNRANYLGYDDWRLPTMVQTDVTLCNWSASGGTDCGYNVRTGSIDTTVYSELASLWYDTLGNHAYYDTTGNPVGCHGGPPNFSCLYESGPFANLQSDSYWFGLADAWADSDAWRFDTGTGLQYAYLKYTPFRAWAVRTGDVGAVPIPATLWLFGSGLVTLAGTMRRRHRLAQSPDAAISATSHIARVSRASCASPITKGGIA